jgi:glutamate racemase
VAGDSRASERPIGVFDSGVGGLTVLRALRESLPGEALLYLGDTARVPYGTKSDESVHRYARQAALRLVEEGIKLLVVACNTASAVALEDLTISYAPLPVVGVVQPSARAACRSSASGRIVVVATEATVRGGAYGRAIRAARADACVDEVACSLFVALAEEGWFEGAIAESVVERYLGELFCRPREQAPDTLVLGCTHFPLLAPAIGAVVGRGVTIVDSASTTAADVKAELTRRGLLREGSGPADTRFLATDGVERFASVGSRFLCTPIDPADVELIDL